MVLDFIGYSYRAAYIIDIIILLIVSLISYQSFNIYRLLKENKYKIFSMSFFSIGLAYLLKIFFDLTIIHRISIKQFGPTIVILRESGQIQLLNFLSFVSYKLFLLLGFLLLFLIILKSSKKSEIIFFIYTSLVVVLFSIYFNFIFYLTISLILLILIMHFYKNLKIKKTKNTILVFSAFVWMLIGTIIATISEFYKINYLIWESLILLGFVFLLINHLSLKNKNDKKKNKT